MTGRNLPPKWDMTAASPRGRAARFSSEALDRRRGRTQEHRGPGRSHGATVLPSRAGTCARAGAAPHPGTLPACAEQPPGCRAPRHRPAGAAAACGPGVWGDPSVPARTTLPLLAQANCSSSPAFPPQDPRPAFPCHPPKVSAGKLPVAVSCGTFHRLENLLLT